MILFYDNCDHETLSLKELVSSLGFGLTLLLGVWSLCLPILELMYVIFSDSFQTWVGLGRAMASNLFFNLMIFY